MATKNIGATLGSIESSNLRLSHKDTQFKKDPSLNATALITTSLIIKISIIFYLSHNINKGANVGGKKDVFFFFFWVERVDFKYEKLQQFCVYSCDIGRGETGCDALPSDEERKLSHNLGPWIRPFGHK
jgi:hypothetical protein